MTITKVDDKYGRWTVVEFSHRNKYRNDYWLCRCDCGTEKVVQGGHLRNGTSESCGCLQKELAAEGKYVHGLSYHPLKSIYYAMLARCYNPNDSGYKDYGGRGIKVCDRWRESIENFVEDMGNKPPNKSLDRIDNNGDYSPENCRWATQSQQNNNNRNTHHITWHGQTKSLKEWAKELGIKYTTLSGRINSYGWSIEEAFTRKVDKRCHHKSL